MTDSPDSSGSAPKRGDRGTRAKFVAAIVLFLMLIVTIVLAIVFNLRRGGDRAEPRSLDASHDQPALP